MLKLIHIILFINIIEYFYFQYIWRYNPHSQTNEDQFLYINSSNNFEDKPKKKKKNRKAQKKATKN